MRDTTQITRTRSPLAEASAKLRAAVRAAVKDETIALPAGTKVSVRNETGSLYACMRIHLTGAPESWMPVAGMPLGTVRDQAAETALDALRDLLAEHRISYAWGEVMVDGRIARSIDKDGWRPGED